MLSYLKIMTQLGTLTPVSSSQNKQEIAKEGTKILIKEGTRLALNTVAPGAGEAAYQALAPAIDKAANRAGKMAGDSVANAAPATQDNEESFAPSPFSMRPRFINNIVTRGK